MERLVVVWCPALLVEGDRGEEARAFDRVLQVVGSLCPWVEPVRLGVCALPARGPSRFFGGEAAVAALLAGAVSPVIAEMTSVTVDDGDGPSAQVGVADGLFAATLAARSRTVVPAGDTRDFLAPWSVAVLGRPELAVTLQRLGVRTLGQLAALPARRVGERFDADALVCHRVARGEEGELPGVRDPGIGRRLETVRGGEPGERVRQHGFFGGTSEADVQASASVGRVRTRLGPAGVLIARLRGGRGPAERGWLVPWGSAEATSPATPSRGRTKPAPPWPGSIPPPAPAVVLASPTPAELADPDARPVQVSGRGLLSGDPALVSVGGGPWEDVVGWAGPWPASERWWAQRRRHARLQVVTVSGSRQIARLLVAERGRWWVEALYD